MSDSLIAIDLGTSRLKVAAVALDGTLQYALERRHQESKDQFGAIQDPAGWWTDTQELLKNIVAKIPGQVLGIAISGRGGAGIFLDDNDRAITGVWRDSRHAEQLKALRQASLDCPSVVLNVLAKYQWVKEQNSPPIKRICYAKDYLLLCLTGEHQTDWATGPDGSAWGDAEDVVGNATRLPTSRLPWDIAGTIKKEVAALAGLPSDTPVVVGAHDGLAANIGSGAVSDRDLVVTLGTHAVVRANSAHKIVAAHHFYKLPPDLNIYGGNALWAGRSVDWFLDLVHRSGEFDLLTSKRKPGAKGVSFLPYLGGQVAPERNAHRTGRFVGLRLEHDHMDLGQSILEGTSFAVKEIFNQVVGWTGAPNFVRLSGGGSKSEGWVRILANTLNQTLELSDGYVESRGAAMCLAVALGHHVDLRAASENMLVVTEAIKPERELVEEYAELYEQWAQLDRRSLRRSVRSVGLDR
ncbi:MAG: hypothetical protein GKR90_08195 [Pseudomonadales bacterium]|nr:hypothetical protein [Pseudomonadales bacterium]